MNYKRGLLITALGFLFAEFFVLLGVRVVINGFKFQHLWLGIALMLFSLYMDRRGKNLLWMDIFWFGLGIAVNDLIMDPYNFV